MDEHYRRMVDFLVAEGTDKVPHTETSFLAHLIGVSRDLETWGCEKEVCRAGMFHSIYGTEPFQGFKLPLERRDEVRNLIGERAERLAYLNSAMTRSTFDKTIQQAEGPRKMVDRFSGREIDLPPGDFEDLCTIHLCDWLEQVERYGKWDSRRAAFRRLAEMLSGVAMESYKRVFAREPKPVLSPSSGA